MTGFFENLMYVLLGNFWLRFKLRQETRIQLQVKKIEIGLHRSRISQLEEEAEELGQALSDANTEEVTFPEYTAEEIAEKENRHDRAFRELRKEKEAGLKAKQETLFKRKQSVDMQLAKMERDLQNLFAAIDDEETKLRYLRRGRI